MITRRLPAIFTAFTALGTIQNGHAVQKTAVHLLFQFLYVIQLSRVV